MRLTAVGLKYGREVPYETQTYAVVGGGLSRRAFLGASQFGDSTLDTATSLETCPVDLSDCPLRPLRNQMVLGRFVECSGIPTARTNY